MHPYEAQFHNWLQHSPPGAVYTYHEGNLAEDRARPVFREGSDYPVRWEAVEPFNAIGHAALEAATTNHYILLVQRRLGENHWQYEAYRTGVAFKEPIHV